MTDQASAIALCELNDIREDLQIAESDTSFDDRIRRTISGVSKAIETATGREFLARDIASEKYDGSGTNVLLLRHFPILKVSSLTIDSTAISASDYVIYYDDGKLAFTTAATFTKGIQNVSITMRIGWERDKLPEDIVLAARLWTVHIFKIVKEQRQGIDSLTKPDESISYSPRRMPDEVRELIEPYRLWR